MENDAIMSAGEAGRWREEFRRELVENILPFWMTRAFDPAGGFYGKIDCDMTVEKAAPRSAVLETRILWTFAAACRIFGDAYRPAADHSFAYVCDRFFDPGAGGVYWLLDAGGQPLADRKQIYAQAFAIYGLAEYYRATGCGEALACAQDLSRLIEEKSRDTAFGGYWEARARDWSPLADMRLSEKDLNSPKSMNTHLHVMEAYTNLLRVWRDPGLIARQTDLLRLVLTRIFDAKSGHLMLFFDEKWRPLTHGFSFGHDIETSWLLCEAAEVLGDKALQAEAKKAALQLAEAVYRQGLDADGSLFYEADENGVLTDANKHWWAEAEAVTGFYNAFQLSGEARFASAARRAWDYIETHVIDRRSGEWHAKLARDGRPLTPEEDGDACLAGPWKCPYHNSRVAFEMLARLKPAAAE